MGFGGFSHHFPLWTAKTGWSSSSAVLGKASSGCNFQWNLGSSVESDFRPCHPHFFLPIFRYNPQTFQVFFHYLGDFPIGFQSLVRCPIINISLRITIYLLLLYPITFTWNAWYCTSPFCNTLIHWISYHFYASCISHSFGWCNHQVHGTPWAFSTERPILGWWAINPFSGWFMWINTWNTLW